MLRFGLIGKHIDYSFSKAYFTTKFETLGLPHEYANYDLPSISEFPNVIAQTKNLRGLNVTIPYKKKVIPYLDKLDKKAKKIGAVNTIKITKKGKLIGYNTDYYGFKKSIQPLLQPHHKRALILGTGGASLGVEFALKQLDILVHHVSRTAKPNCKYTYNDLTEDIIGNYSILINCTPLGTHPNVADCPPIPYNGISSKHLLYDLIYNPAETAFLKQGNKRGAIVYNGRKMLELQAEKAWKLWR